MSYYPTYSNYNATGAIGILYSVRDGISGSFEFMSFIIFLLLFFGNMFVKAKRFGRYKILVSLMASSFVMIILTMMLTLADLVSYRTVVLYSFITIVAYILSLVSDKE